MRTYEDLIVWEKAAELVERLASERGLRRNGDGLRGQIRRAAVSVASNIAEGRARGGEVEFRHFLSIARGSCSEVQAQLRLAYRSGNLSQENFLALLDIAMQIGWMLTSLIRRLAPP